MYLSITDLILLALVQAVITANLVLCGFYLRDVHIQRRADRMWAQAENQAALDDAGWQVTYESPLDPWDQPIGWDHATTDEIVRHLDNDLPY